jgi:hypothetical protein
MQAADNWQKHGKVVVVRALSLTTAVHSGFHHSAVYPLTFRTGAKKVWIIASNWAPCIVANVLFFLIYI